jgi:hypothetical protein
MDIGRGSTLPPLNLSPSQAMTADITLLRRNYLKSEQWLATANTKRGMDLIEGLTTFTFSDRSLASFMTEAHKQEVSVYMGR